MPVIILVWLSLIIVAAGGWIANIVKLVGSLGDPMITPMFIARCVGAFMAPLGVVLGFL